MKRANKSILDIHIPSSWPSRPNPFAGEAHQATRDLALNLEVLPDDARVLRRFDGSKFSMLTAFAFPNADCDRFILCNDWHCWLFFFDDAADEDVKVGKNTQKLRDQIHSCMRVLRGEERPHEGRPFERFTADIRKRLLRYSSAAWRTRFFANVEDYLLRGTLSAAENWERRAIPSVNAYLTQRIYDSAVYTCQDLTEIARDGCELPEEVVANEVFRALRSLSVTVVAFTNDIFSYEKEVLRHRNMNNLIHVLMANECFSFEEAVTCAVDIIHRDVDSFIDLERKLPSWGAEVDAKVGAYNHGLKAFMRGNFVWSLMTGRYSSETSPFPELRTIPARAASDSEIWPCARTLRPGANTTPHPADSVHQSTAA